MLAELVTVDKVLGVLNEIDGAGLQHRCLH